MQDKQQVYACIMSFESGGFDTYVNILNKYITLISRQADVLG